MTIQAGLLPQMTMIDKAQQNLICPCCKSKDIEISQKEGSLLCFCSAGVASVRCVLRSTPSSSNFPNVCEKFFQPTPKFWDKVVFKNAFQTEKEATR